MIIDSKNEVNTTYNDFSSVREEDINLIFQRDAIINPITLKTSQSNFPVKLHYMLSELEKDGLHEIISWQPHGRCFVVHKQKELVDKILPL